MSEMTYNTKMLGLVTLYNPNPQEASSNIKKYIDDVDALIIWDNSPLEKCLKTAITSYLSDYAEKIIWHGDGNNYCIAPALKFACIYAQENGYGLLLIMDQDSKWVDFVSYRRNVEEICEKEVMAFTPYVVGCDRFEIKETEQEKEIFINSGTVIPTQIIHPTDIDEKAFPLDALDNDISLTLKEKGYKILCLTTHKLDHSLGQLQYMGPFKILTPNYNSARTYSIIRAHVICYRKHRKSVSKEYRNYFYSEIIYYRLIRIIFAEPEKWSRLKAFIKGFISGLLYKIK